jgi:hypothetical protein
VSSESDSAASSTVALNDFCRAFARLARCAKEAFDLQAITRMIREGFNVHTLHCESLA